MTARIVVNGEKLTNVTHLPRQALFEKEGKKLVYRKNGNRYEPVEVAIGSSSAGRVVVTKGLRKDDEIALEDPEKNDDRGARNASS